MKRSVTLFSCEDDRRGLNITVEATIEVECAEHTPEHEIQRRAGNRFRELISNLSDSWYKVD